MGMTWRTLSSTLTEKAGSSSWVSPSWRAPGEFLFNQSHWKDLYHCHCMIFYFIAALCTFFFLLQKKTQAKHHFWFRRFTFFLHGELCDLSSTKGFWIFFPLPVSLSSVFLFPVIPPFPFSDLFWLLLCLTCDFSAAAGAVHPSGGTYSLTRTTRREGPLRLGHNDLISDVCKALLLL